MSPLLQDVSTTFVAKIVATLVGFMASVIVIRALQPELFGVYVTVFSAVQVALAIGGLGIGKAVVYELGRKRYQVDEIIRVTWRFGIRNAGVLCGLIVLWGWFGATRPWWRVEFGVTVWAVPLAVVGLLASYGEGILRGRQRIRACNVMSASSAVVFLLAAVAVAMFAGARPEGFLLARAVESGAGLLFAGWALRTVVRGTRVINSRLARDMLSYGVSFSIYSGLLILNYRAAVFLLNALAGAREAGLYAAAHTLASPLLLVPEAMVFPLFPYVATASEREGRTHTLRACRAGLALLLLPAMVLAFVAPRVLGGLFGEPFTSAGVAGRLLVLAMLCLFVFHILAGYFAGRGRQRVLMYCAAVGLAVNVGCNAWLIPRFGVTGAACASLASYGSLAVAAVWVFTRGDWQHVRALFWMRSEDLAFLWSRVAWPGPKRGVWGARRVS